jgi:hypothetical protein
MQTERDALNDEGRAIKKRLRLTISNELADAAAQSGQGAPCRAFTEYERQVALTIFMMAECCVSPAIAYMSASPAAGGNLEELILAWASDRPPEELLTLAFTDEAPKRSVYMRASKFYAKCRLEDWIARRNDDQGIAPPTASVLHQHDALLAEHLGEGLLRSRGDMGLSRNRQWATRMRRDFCCKLGVPKFEEDLSAAEIQAKAYLCSNGRIDAYWSNFGSRCFIGHAFAALYINSNGHSASPFTVLFQDHITGRNRDRHI